jgi:hypothetical protein
MKNNVKWRLTTANGGQCPAGADLLPSWDRLSQDVKNMIGREPIWNQKSDQQKKVLLAIVAKMIDIGLSDYFADLRIRWRINGDPAADFTRNCGIGYGHVFFTGQQLWEAYFIGYLGGRNPSNPFRRFFRVSRGLAQRNHPGFPFGAREKSNDLSLHLSFTNPSIFSPGVIEAHIDRHGTLYRHLRNEVFGRGVPFTLIWDALLNDGSAGEILKWLLDQPQPPKPEISKS